MDSIELTEKIIAEATMSEKTLFSRSELKTRWNKFTKRIKDMTKAVQQSVKGEWKETQNMFVVFAKEFKRLLGVNNPLTDQPTPDEVRRALQHLKSMPKFAVIATMFLSPLPGTGISYLLVASVLDTLTKGKVNLLPDKVRKAVRGENVELTKDLLEQINFMSNELDKKDVE